MGHPKGLKNRYYSKEEKMRIVKEVESGHSSKQVAQTENISDSLIRTWVRAYRNNGEDALTAKRKQGNPLAGYANKKSPTELEQLRHELALAHMEIARLKKTLEPQLKGLPVKK